MGEAFSLQEIYEHPVVAEIIDENRKLRTLSEKPEVKDLKNVPLPYTIKRHLCINEGVHNGVTYPAQMLRMAVKQHEGLPLFLDHHPNDQGGTVETWVGEIRNPVWSEADKAIVGDIDIVDPRTAMALAYGAKFGISATVAVETLRQNSGEEIANDPVFKSYSLVLDPAVRETMLNENQGDLGEKQMEEQLDLKSDLTPAISTLDDAISRASAMKDTSLKTMLEKVKAIVSKLAGKSYPYPKPSGKLEDAALEARLATIESNLHISTEPLSNTELEATLKENEKLKEQLGEIESAKLAERLESVLKKELELGLVATADTESRRKELQVLDASALNAVEQNVDKTIEILNAKPAEDSKPDVGTDASGERKELSAKSSGSSAALLNLMATEQQKGFLEYGGRE